MSKSRRKEPLLFIDTFQRGCLVTEQSVFKTPDITPKDVIESDYVHHYDKKTASDFYKWPSSPNEVEESHADSEANKEID